MSTTDPRRQPQSWEHLLEKDPHTGTGFRVGIVVAALVHTAIFAVTWPTIAQSPPEAPEEEFIYCELIPVVAEEL